MTSPARPVAGTALALLITLALAACSGSGADESTAESGGSVAQQDAGAAASVAPGAADEESAVVDREVVVTGWAELVADDPVATIDEIVRMVEQAGGRIENLVESPGTDGEPGYASATARLPVDLTTGTVDALADVAELRRVEIGRQDVTSQGQDLDARISALTTSTTRLTELMGSAATTADLLDVERELAARQTDLDSLVAQREALSDQVAMSTIDISVTATSAPVAAPRSGFVDGLGTGWAALVATVGTVVLVVGVLLPWLLPVAAAYVVYRLVRRRRATPPTGPGGGDHGPGDDDGPAPGAPVQDPEREPALTP
ncbi:uncharacterized protein DUF4349 [Isoptericola jiangsuensis]|uniref:Uncharacterized protein DUF4349 n=1 Tax=Isoptericola jiangsuensis TaxID=548579 RepID=A0A2A9EVH8_9MICO|nr:DUF4349 domain-containing protein [Isoptericola jiangsuensis]PFG42566.1 uncharacterized protein DUF4349 [Isoptericola jiangsuensis]